MNDDVVQRAIKLLETTGYSYFVNKKAGRRNWEEARDEVDGVLRGLRPLLAEKDREIAGLRAENDSLREIGNAAIRCHKVNSETITGLREIVRFVAETPTIEELLNGNHVSEWNDLAAEQRIEKMGERKREKDAMILRARQALALTKDASHAKG